MILKDLIAKVNSTNRFLCKNIDEDIACVENAKEIYAQVNINMNVIERSIQSESDNK